MQRDKKGRFVKKAEGGTQLLKDTLTLRNGKTYKLKQGMQANLQQDSWLTLAMQNPDAYEQYLSQYYDPVDASSPDSAGGEVSTTNNSSVTNSINIPGFNANLLTTPIKFDYNLNAPVDQQGQFKLLQQNKTYGLGPEQKIKITQKEGKYYDERGVEVPLSLVMTNPNSYEIGFLEEFKDFDPSKTSVKEDSKGMNITIDDPLKQHQNQGQKPLDKTKMANFLEFARAGIGAAVNNKIAERALEAEKPFLQDVSESHRPIYGDYRAQVEGEKAAAQLRKAASQPLTSDGALQQQMMMEAQIKGQEYINKGNAQDEAVIKQTREVALAQEKENAQQRQAAAMQNRQAMLMSEKNKAQIENSRDSANFSQVVAPLMGGIEQRLRNEGKLQQYYQDYYDDATVAQEVWNTFDTGLSETQKALRNEYLTGGTTKVKTYVGTDTKKYNDWLQLQQIMNQEVMKRKAAIKGAFINPVTLGFQTQSKNNPYGIFVEGQSQFKKGGTIYKAKLSKRTKDNDRGAKSIESSKKIAARFLEKAIDSLYSYDDVELIAKPKNKKRKYQAGGGLPFVNFAPVFATSETGTPTTTKAKEDTKTGEDLTTKDVLELLKDIDGLHSDIDVIQASLSDFLIADKMDPLGLDSSSSIASRYMSLIGKIKKAKSNREWYDKAYEKLSTNGALNEYAVDSTGHFIGMNQEGDFARFTAQQVASGDTNNYTLLTNSNLLDIRNRYPTAAFNSNLIMEAANGVSMQQITDYINKTIQGLGSDKTQTQVFGDRSKDVLSGLQQLQKAAKEIGQDLSISELYEAQIFTESQAKQAELALSYLYQTLPTNMKALLFAKAGSQAGALKLINDIVYSKVSTTTKLEFSPKNSKKTSSSKTGNVMLDGLNLSPAQMLQQGFGERESITIQDASSAGLKVDAVTMPITTGSTGDPLGAATLEDVATSNYGGILNFNNASMGGQLIPFEGRRNIAIDGSKIYSMYLPVDQEELMKNNIMPDIALIDKVNKVNQEIKEKNITDINEINQVYVDAGLPVYLNQDGTVVSTMYRRFGVLNGTAIDNAFGKNFISSRYLKKIDDEDIINGAISVMNKGRSKEDKIEYDAESFLNFGGLIGDYDSVYQGTIFIPISNDVFLGIAGSGQNVTSTEANQLFEAQQQKERVSATYKNPGQLR